MRGWYAWALCAAIATVSVGCDNEGKVEGDAGGSGGSAGDAGSGGSSGDDSGTPPPPPPSPCTRSEDCDDGVYCNGAEMCVGRVCRAGAAPSCDDGITCTIDRCDESRQACVSSAADDDGDGHLDATCLDSVGDALGDDCDDADSTRYPGALEVCDADDHDEDCDLTTFGRVDFDGDSYLNANCCNIADDGSATCGDDCDDANARVHPFNTESCDGLDNDCNGALDHPTEDQDHDGFATVACGGTDCDDFNAMTFAGAMERCDGIDNDCLQGGGVAQDETDLDSDAYVTGVCMKMEDTDLSPGDCDEDRRSANPMRDELCNGKDDDCDGATDEGSMDCSHAVKQVDAGYLQTCAVRVDGTVACWGRNYNGYLCTGADAWVLDYPRSVIDPRDRNRVLSNVRSVSVGRTHACALHADGRISCWGTNYDGELGVGSISDGVELAVDVTGVNDAVEVCAGWGYSCGRGADGAVACWGDNWTGQLGDGTLTDRHSPATVSHLDPSVDIDCADNYACSVSAQGNVQCWGQNATGQLGDVTTTTRATPVDVLGVEGAVLVTVAREHACALLMDETVMCWGDNTYGQRATGQSGGTSLASPMLRFTGVAIDDVVEVTAGGGSIEWQDPAEEVAHTCVRLRDGTVQCVGSNLRAQLGYGEGTSSLTPASAPAIRFPVLGIDDAIQIAAGHQHTCALAPDGRLLCWGDDESGQLAGNGGWGFPAEMVEGL